MPGPVKAVPDGFNTLSAHLAVRNAASAIEFYKKAFGAEEIFRMPGPGGKGVMHAEVKFGNSTLMLCEEMPGDQCSVVAPQSVSNKCTAVLHLYVENADAMFDRAVKAGAKVVMPMMDAFWGDRYGQVTDPFGQTWSIATHKKDLTPDQIAKGAQEFFASMGAPKKH